LIGRGEGLVINFDRNNKFIRREVEEILHALEKLPSQPIVRVEGV